VQRCGSGALVQQILGTTLGLHYYLSTFHPAMIALAPEAVLGVPTGMPTYFMQVGYPTLFAPAEKPDNC
jgi:hypothetical protein